MCKFLELNGTILNRCTFKIILYTFGGKAISDNKHDSTEDVHPHLFREKTDKVILKIRPWKEYKLHIVVLIIVIISELIGVRKFNLTPTVSIIIMPLLYAMIFGLGLFLYKPFKAISKRQSKVAEAAMLLFIGPLIAKLAVSSGYSFLTLFEVGPALILQELGNLGTIFLALPIALLLGFKREVIGMTCSIGREPNVAVVIDEFGFDSPEARGVLTVFVIGTVVGTLFISLLSSLFSTLIPLHPYAFAMASGIGSASMNAAALAPLLLVFPDLAIKMEAFAGISNLISFCLGIYACIFLAIPLTKFCYRVLEPILGRRNENKEEKD